MLINTIFDTKHKRHCIDMQQNPDANLGGLFAFLQDPALPVYNLQGLVPNYEAQASHSSGFHFSKLVHNVRPPYNRIWAEFKAPQIAINNANVRMGALVEFNYIGDYETTRASLVETRKTMTSIEVQELNLVDEHVRAQNEKVTFTDACAVTASLVIEGEDMLFAYPRTVHVVCTKLGEPITVPFAPIYPVDFGSLGTPEFMSNAARLRQVVGQRCNVIWFAMTLLNCTNIEAQKHAPDVKLQRARVRRGQSPLRDFYTLNVRVPKSKRSATSPSSKSLGDLVAFHSVAGHLADYREGKGLFGKYKGVFWIPAHVRGNKNNGTINKQYALKGK